MWIGSNAPQGAHWSQSTSGDLNRLMKAQRTVERQNGTLAIGKQPVASSRAWRPAMMTTKPSPGLATSRCWVRLRRKTSTLVNRPSGSVGRAVEETSLAERAVTSQEET